MESLYAKYLKERTDDNIIETEQGFCTYRYLNEKQVYIIDLYVLPEFRKKGFASCLVDIISEEAKSKGSKEMIGTVVPTCKGSTQSISGLIYQGFFVSNSSDNLIIFKKDLF